MLISYCFSIPRWPVLTHIRRCGVTCNTRLWRAWTAASRQHRAPDTGHRPPATTGHRALGAGHRAPGTGRRAPGTGHWSPCSRWTTIVSPSAALTAHISDLHASQNTLQVICNSYCDRIAIGPRVNTSAPVLIRAFDLQARSARSLSSRSSRVYSVVYGGRQRPLA